MHAVDTYVIGYSLNVTFFFTPESMKRRIEKGPESANQILLRKRKSRGKTNMVNEFLGEGERGQYDVGIDERKREE
jgi:hypothetical protein